MSKINFKPLPGEWSWVPTGGRAPYRLITPHGHHAATVYDNQTWFLFNPQGDGTLEANAASLDEAMGKAFATAKVYWYENGWESPFGLEIRQGSRVTYDGHPALVGEVNEDGTALILIFPEKAACVRRISELKLLPPTDHPSAEEGDEGSYDSSLYEL